jgi:Zn-dependent peptidase ImmA (M78 family)
MYATKRTLAHAAMLESIKVRSGAKVGLDGPLDIFDLSEKLGLRVRFVDFSMEGMYKRGRPAQILLSAMRPLARRTFTCAHEIGHHVFKHGSTIDELVDNHDGPTSSHPEEFLAQTFAGFLLMPTLGMRKAFAQRGWRAAEATPGQLLTIASAYGVGYTTVIHHLAYGLEMLPSARAQALARVPVAKVRHDVLGTASSAPLIIVDCHWALPTIDAEVGTHILLPSDATSGGDLLAHREETSSGRLFEAVRPGIVQVERHHGENMFVRIARHQYVGLSQYRHLEETDDEEQDE